MHWTQKSKQQQPYCAAHNYQCPLRSHLGDPMVLDVSPHLTPGAWICPQAVKEIADFANEADEMIEQNSSAAGLMLTDTKESILIKTLGLEDLHEIATKIREEGAEALTYEEIDACIYALEEHQHETNSEFAEELHEQLVGYWEDG